MGDGRRTATPSSAEATRRSYLDLLRILAIVTVVTGHWLLIDISDREGRLTGHDALAFIPWAGWLTLVFQVMPVFFLVGGYVNAGSWLAHSRGGGRWGTWVGARARRLLRPTSVYVGGVVATVVLASTAGRAPDELAQAAWLLCLHLWFLPTYLLAIALTPVMLAANERWGLLVPAAMATGAAVVDVAVLRAGVPLIGFANYLLVWGSMHQWGFIWRERARGVSVRGAVLLMAGGATLFGVLVLWGEFPADLIGARNTSPPSIALLAFAAAQTGLVVLVERFATGLLDRGYRGRRLQRLNASAMTVYLWHMVPVVLVAMAVYPHVAVPQPAIGSTAWWAMRPLWVGVLGALLAPVTLAVDHLQRRLVPGRPRPTLLSGGPPLLPALGLAAVAWALARLAIAGAAPTGHLTLSVVCVYGVGVLLVEAAAADPARVLALRRRHADSGTR